MGQCFSGASDVDQATITGESLAWCASAVNDTVFAGTMNGVGHAPGQRDQARLREHTGPDPVRVVSDARKQQGRTQRFAGEAFEGRYAIGVMLLSALVFLFDMLVLDQQPGGQLLPRDDDPGGHVAVRPGDLHAGVDPLGARQRGPARHPVQGRGVSRGGGIESRSSPSTRPARSPWVDPRSPPLLPRPRP